MNTKVQLLAVAVSVALAQPALAQESKNQQKLAVTVVGSESIERDAVVKTITAEEIDKQQINSLDDLVRNVPGVTVSKGDERWGSSGFNIRGLDENRVAINVDGVPQGETLKNEGGQAYGYFKGSRNGVDTEALKQVEIVKGADAILSGSGALAGAVNFVTKDAADFLNAEGNDTAFETKMGYAGANSESKVSFALANRTGDLESLLIYTYRDSNEYENYDMGGLDVEGATREIPNPQDNDSKSVLAKLKYNISSQQSLELSGSFYQQNTFSEEKTFNGTWYNDRVGDDVRETKRLGLKYLLEADTVAFDEMEAAFTSQDIDFTANTIQYVTISIPPYYNVDEDRTDARSIDQSLNFFTLDFVKEFGEPGNENTLIYGFEYQDKEIVNKQIRRSNSRVDDSDEWTTRNLGAMIPTTESTISTLYAQNTFQPYTGAKVRVGVRYDDISYDAMSNEDYQDDTGTLGKTDFSSFNWTLGFEQELTNELTLEAGVSTGFRAPTVEEMLVTSGDIDDWSQIPNADLEAEEATNIDIALVGSTDGFNYRLGVWKSDYENFIDTQTVEGINTNTGLPDPDGYRIPVNAGEVDMKGIELSLSADLAQVLNLEGFTTYANAAYTKGDGANGDPVYSIQPLEANWSLVYEDPNGQWGLNFTTTYTRGKDKDDAYTTEEDGSITYPLYTSNTATLFDLVGYYNLTESIQITAGIYNLSDKEYFRWDNVRFVDQGDMRPGIGVRDGGILRFTEPGRNFTLGVTARF